MACEPTADFGELLRKLEESSAAMAEAGQVVADELAARGMEFIPSPDLAKAEKLNVSCVVMLHRVTADLESAIKRLSAKPPEARIVDGVVVEFKAAAEALSRAAILLSIEDDASK